MFETRAEAGKLLAAHLLAHRLHADLVLGLPRGGVIVAAEVASVLKLPLDALVVRKVGHPQHREVAVGAMAEDGTMKLDDGLGHWLIPPSELERVIAEESARLKVYHSKFHVRPAVDLRGKRVLIIDDGLATGATAEVAVISARHRGAETIRVAVPIASPGAITRVENVADAVTALRVDPKFEAVGRYYENFPQTTDEEVIHILAQGTRNPD
jgi:putative phosphoribosyl transferase